MNYPVREANYLISQLMKLLMITDDHFRGLFFILEAQLARFKVLNCV